LEAAVPSDRSESWRLTGSSASAQGQAIFAEEPLQTRPAPPKGLFSIPAVDADGRSFFFDGARGGPAAPATDAAGRPLSKPGKKAAPIPPQSDPDDVFRAATILPRGRFWDARRKAKLPVPGKTRDEVARIAFDEAVRSAVDPLFLLSFVSKESGFNAKAVGPFGEFGLMQLMPETAVGLAQQVPGLEELAQSGTRTLKKGAHSCERLAEALLERGKVLTACALQPSGETSLKPKAKTAPYEVRYLDLFEPRTNLRLGAAYVKELWDTFAKIPFEQLPAVDPRKRKDIKAVVSAFNAGAPVVERTIGKFGRPPHATEEYVETFIKGFYLKVSGRFQKLAHGAPR
jgi:hypothetical protein